MSIPGSFPNLCSGILTLEINGKIYKFGHDCLSYNFKSGKYDGEDENNPNFQKFWYSGGFLDKDYCAIQAEWEIDVSKLPEELKKYAAEIDEIFNANVDYGCCGGCA